jgi:hypothetical protein
VSGKGDHARVNPRLGRVEWRLLHGNCGPGGAVEVASLCVRAAGRYIVFAENREDRDLDGPCGVGCHQREDIVEVEFGRGHHVFALLISGDDRGISVWEAVLQGGASTGSSR